MIRFECDTCGASLGANDANRFIVRIEAFAAAGPLEFTADDLRADATSEIRKLIDQLHMADADEIEDQTYRSMRFDLCAACHRAYLKDPLGRNGRRG